MTVGCCVWEAVVGLPAACICIGWLCDRPGDRPSAKPAMRRVPRVRLLLQRGGRSTSSTSTLGGLLVTLLWGTAWLAHTTPNAAAAEEREEYEQHLKLGTVVYAGGACGER